MPLGRLIGVVGAQFGRYSQRVLAEHGATASSVGVLGALACEDGLSHREMARRLWLTPATLTPVVDALEQAGHVRRHRDPDDRRVVRLHLTDEGREWLRSTYSEVARAFRARIPPPPPGHEQIIRDYLVAVLAAINETDGPPWPTRPSE